MYLEIFALVASCTAAGASCALYWGARRFNRLAVRAANVATASAEQAQSKSVSAAVHTQNAAKLTLKAQEHAEHAAEHRAACHDHSITVADYAQSMGVLALKAQEQAQTKVRLVHRTDYSTKGSNIGGK